MNTELKAQESWRPVADCDAYEVSDRGNVRRVKPGRGTRTGLLKLSERGDGYLEVSICVDGRSRRQTVHRLVAQAFLGLPDDLDVDHRDADRSNNDVFNLRPCTKADNNRYSAARGVHAGERHGMAKLAEADVLRIRSLAARGVPQKELASEYGVWPSAISKIVNGKLWTHVVPSDPACKAAGGSK